MTFIMHIILFWREKKVKQKPLPYCFDGLEPVISQDSLEFQYKQHGIYVKKLRTYLRLAEKALDAGEFEKI